MRFEVKFAYAPDHEGQVLDWLQSHGCVFREAYPPRRVQNVYFDTFDLQAFGENLAGISRRSKVRFRWYGDEDLLLPAGTLEIKNKHSTLGWKDSCRMPAPYAPGDSWRSVHRAIRAHLPGGMRIVFDDHPQATLINRYSRRYYESADHKLRVTLDSDQVMFDQLHSRTPNITRRSNIPDVHILELKCESVDKVLATKAIGNCPVRVSRFSKYTVGVELR